VRKQKTKELDSEQKQLASMVFVASKNAMLITDKDYNVVLVNSAFTEITGYSLKEIIGKNPRVLKSGKHGRQFYKNLWDELLHKDFWQGTIWNRRKNGELYLEWVTIHAVRDEQGQLKYFFAIFSDITHNKALEIEIQQLKNYDPLTQLPNKTFFIEQLKVALANLTGEQKLAVLLLNINRFKKVNDAYGIAYGDSILQITAKRVRKLLRPNIIFVRDYADRYLILMPLVNNYTNVLSVANRILETFKNAFHLNNNQIYLSATIGATITKNKVRDARRLLKQINLALDKAKRDPTVPIAFFDSSMDHLVKHRVDVEADLYQALKRNEFRLHYQPQVDINSKKMTGVEALLRWQHPTKGLLYPGDFIDITFDSGLIIPIGEWVLNTACQQAVLWKKQGLPAFFMAVNVSALQFRQRNFQKVVQDAIHRSGMDPANLELELTEQIVLDDFETAIQMLSTFKELGVRLSLDDFGTGYSSMSYLKKLPIDKLKIDISFIQNITSSKQDLEIVKAIIALAKTLKIKVIAEGVETKEQLEILLRLQCNEVQGFYFSQAISADALLKKCKEGCF